MEYIDGITREDHFKDDVKPRGDMGFDTRDARVRRQSIGWLDDTYLSRRSVLQPKYVSDAFTRVPPLNTLPTIFDGRDLREASFKKANQLVSLGLIGLASVYAFIRAGYLRAREVTWEHMPKTYAVDRGAFIEWPIVRRRALAVVMPLAILTIILIVLTSFNSTYTFRVKSKPNVYSSSKSSPSSSSPSTGSTTQASSSSSSNPANNAIGSTPSGAVSSSSSYNSATSGSYSGNQASTLQSAAPTSSSTSSSSTSSSPSASTSSSTTNGGTGGGTGGGGTSSSSSSLLPATVTVPAINTSLGGKTLLDTSSTTLTIN